MSLCHSAHSPLLDLPLVLFQDILRLLHEEDYASFLAIRSAFKASRFQSEAILFRKLWFRTGDETEQSILDRLNDAQDYLATRVQSIGIQNRYPNALHSETLQKLAKALEAGRLKRLDTLVWDTRLHMPEYLLSALHSQPKVRLHVINTSRHYLAMQHDLLSSASLYSLDFVVLTRCPGKTALSEFFIFKKLLLQARNLRYLTLRSQGVFRERQLKSHSDFKDGEYNLQFEPGDQFPTLHELTIREENQRRHHLTSDHCMMWAQCMDWSSLRSLDLGKAMPQYLMPVLIGRVPQLKALHFGFRRIYCQPGGSWHYPHDMTVVDRFVESIDALERVTLEIPHDEQSLQVRQTVLNCHGQSLKYLEVLPVAPVYEHAMTLEDLQEMLEKAPGVEELKVPVNIEKEAQHDEIQPSPSRWPTQIQHALSSYRPLRHLTLSVRLECYSYQFVMDTDFEAPCAINDEFAENTVKSFFNDFGPGTAMEKLTVRFLAHKPRRIIWVYTAKRKWIPKAGNYGVVVDRKIEGECEESERILQRYRYGPKD